MIHYFQDVCIGVVSQYLSLLNMPIPLQSFILTWDNCSSKSFPGYLNDWVGIICFPWSLNLNEESSFRLFGQNIISSVFYTFRYNLFALNQYERFDRFSSNCLSKTSKDLFDCIMFVLSAK